MPAGPACSASRWRHARLAILSQREGNMDMPRIHLPLLALTSALMALPAAAQPLTIANVGAPAINCVFSKPVGGKCTVIVTDTVGTIAMPPGVSGVGRVQSRTFAGAAGTPGAGKTAYLYRVDM